MAKKVDTARIEKFYEDWDLLGHYNHNEIAQKTGVSPASISGYFNRTRAVTNTFLKKFYAVFGPELEELSLLNGGNHHYRKPLTGTKRVEDLEKRVEKLEQEAEEIRKDVKHVISGIDQMQNQIAKFDDRLARIQETLNQLAKGDK